MNKVHENQENQYLLAHNREIDENLVSINPYELSNVVKKQQKCRHEKEAFEKHELVQMKKGCLERTLSEWIGIRLQSVL